MRVTMLAELLKQESLHLYRRAILQQRNGIKPELSEKSHGTIEEGEIALGSMTDVRPLTLPAKEENVGRTGVLAMIKLAPRNK